MVSASLSCSFIGPKELNPLACLCLPPLELLEDVDPQHIGSLALSFSLVVVVTIGVTDSLSSESESEGVLSSWILGCLGGGGSSLVRETGSFLAKYWSKDILIVPRGHVTWPYCCLGTKRD